MTVEGLASYVATSVPDPVPEGVTEHQATSLFAIQLELEVTVKFVEPAEEVTVWFGGVTANSGAVPNWVTVTITGGIPETNTVSVATRWLTEVFSV